MKILRITSKIKDEVFKVINDILQNHNDIFGKFSQFIIINTTDNGKNYIIFYSKDNNRLRYELSYKYYNKITMPSKYNDYEKIKIDNKVNYATFLNLSVYDELKCKNIFIIHGTFGWQQVFNSYVYRDLLSVKNKLQRYELDTGDFCFELTKSVNYNQLLKDYDNLIKTIDLLPHDFTLPLLAYYIFSYVKSLFRQYRHNVDISKVDRYFALNIVSTERSSKNKFLVEFIKFFSSFYVEKNIFDPKSYESEIGKINQCMIKDFPVFICNSKISDSEFTTKIPSSAFHKAVTSNISYIYFNLKRFEDFLLNLYVPEDLEMFQLNKKIPTRFPKTLLDDYIDFISKTLSHETYQKEKKRKEKLLNKINDAKEKESQIKEYIGMFLIHIIEILKKKKISVSEYFIPIFAKEIDKFTIKEFELFEKEYNDEKAISYNDISNFAQKYYDKHLLRYEPDFKAEENKNSNSAFLDFVNGNIYITENPSNNINTEIYKDLVPIYDRMYKRYIELHVNSCISISKHHPTYFDDLYKKAEKDLKDNLKGKRYDNVKASRCVFLLAAMMSFKDYIDNRLSEVSDDFNKYFQIFNNSILQMCCIPINENIDNATALSEFTEFLTLQIDNGSIINRSSGTDSKFGWIDRKANKILLKNMRDNNFYDEFIKYLIDRHKRYELSKQAFVRDVLEERGILNKRSAGEEKRYDRERKIGNEKYRVLVLDCYLLGIH